MSVIIKKKKKKNVQKILYFKSCSCSCEKGKLLASLRKIQWLRVMKLQKQQKLLQQVLIKHSNL